MERHIYHRDQFAHYLRWSHVLKVADIGMRILDFGCGTANLLEVLYRNRYAPGMYVGLDIRGNVIKQNRLNWNHLDYAKFEEVDLCSEDPLIFMPQDYDLICSFEVAEHIYKPNITRFLQNIKTCMSTKTRLLISTPCYDETVGAADNHIVNGVIGEFYHDEFKDHLLSNGFKIEKHWGTFASQKDYKHLLTGELKVLFDRLHEYYDSNILACLMAPLFPEQSRNCIWRCSI